MLSGTDFFSRLWQLKVCQLQFLVNPNLPYDLEIEIYHLAYNLLSNEKPKYIPINQTVINIMIDTTL